MRLYRSETIPAAPSVVAPLPTIDVSLIVATIQIISKQQDQEAMQFEWDDEKNEANIRLHKIDFADVPTVFNGPLLTDLDERIEYGEQRWTSIGLLYNLTIVVVWTERENDIIRIISARKANKYERQRYEAYLTNRLGPFS